MANVKTITATTTESYVAFNATYQFMWFRNFGENDCYICAHSGIVAGADDVTLLKAGEVARLTLPQTPAQSKAYIKAVDGNNTVEVHAQNYSDCPFKIGAKGGESGSGGSIYRTTTALTDGAETNPITVNGQEVTAVSGDFAIYNTQEFLYDGTYWSLLGDKVGLGELAYMDTDDIHREISDVEYEALPDAKKNDGTEYFVYETGDDNRSIVCKDANGNFIYRAFVYGVIANGSPGWNKSATDSDAPTTPPTKVNPQASGTALIWGLETSEKTVYFNRFSGNALNGSNASDKDASNIGFMLTGNVNNQYSLTKNGTAWITANFVETLSTDVVTLGKEPTGNRYIKAYDKSYGAGGFTRTVLYDSGGYDKYAPFQTDVPLLDNLSNYDFIVVSIGTDSDNTRLGKYECDSAVYDVQIILRNDYYAHYAGYQRRWCDIHFTDTTFNIMNSETPDESSSLKPCVYFIVGYKF